MDKNLLDNRLTEKFENFEKEFAKERSSFFNHLTKNQQLLVFCEVVNKLVKAELKDHKTYRGVLYEEFRFGTDAYVKAQISGFLELHNSIDKNQIDLLEFATEVLNIYGIEQTKEQVMEKLAQNNLLIG